MHVVYCIILRMQVPYNFKILSIAPLNAILITFKQLLEIVRFFFFTLDVVLVNFYVKYHAVHKLNTRQSMY